MSKGDGLPKGWAIANLGDLTLPRETCNPRNENRAFQYVDIDALDNARQKITFPKTLQADKAPSRARMAIRTGDVVFSLVRPYLKNVAIVPPELDNEIASTAYCVLRPAGGISSEYLFYQVVQEVFINSVPTYGNSPPAARDDEFLSLPVHVAPTNEQRRIVAKLEELLSDLEAGVAALERVRANLKRYRAALLKAAVEGKLTEEWRRENPPTEPASALLDRILKERRKRWEEQQLAAYGAKGKKPPKGWRDKYTESILPSQPELPALPKSWCMATVDQVSEFVRYGSSAKASLDATGVPVLRMGNIQDGNLDLTSLKYLPKDHAEFPDLLLREGDLLFNRTNSAELVGKSAIYRGNPDPCSYASYLIGVRLVGCDSRYLSYFINSVYGRIWVASVVSQQVGQANVNGTKLRALTFPLPPQDEQERIVERVEESVSIVEETEAQIDMKVPRSSRLRQSILKRAFEGKLVPQDPSDEAAHKLLERIKQEKPRQGTGKGHPKQTRRRQKSSRSETQKTLF